MRLFKWAVIALVPLFMAVAFVWSLKNVYADVVVEGFLAKGNLKIGQIVSLSDKAATTVQSSPANESNQIYGVVVDNSKAPITLTHQTQQVYVATGGDYPVMVSDENGPISPGAYISVGSLDGIGIKATPNQPVVLGHADTAFSPPTGVISKSGKYSIGRINVTISVMPNPMFKNTLAIPQPLQKIGNSIAGSEVSPLRVYIALLVFVVATALSVILLTVGVRSALIALGRNPLSRHSILQGMFQVIAVSLVIFCSALVGVYLILKI